MAGQEDKAQATTHSCSHRHGTGLAAWQIQRVARELSLDRTGMDRTGQDKRLHRTRHNTKQDRWW